MPPAKKRHAEGTAPPPRCRRLLAAAVAFEAAWILFLAAIAAIR